MVLNVRLSEYEHLFTDVIWIAPQNECYKNMIHQNSSCDGDFRISEYVEFLTPSTIPSRKKEKKYVCPNCSEHHLSIGKNGHDFSCFNCAPSPSYSCATSKENRNKIASELKKLWWAKYGEKTEKKKPKPQGKREYIYTSEGEEYIKVVITYDENGKKNPPIQYRKENGKWLSGLGENGKEQTHFNNKADLYRINEVKKAIAENKIIFVVEGEGCVETFRELGFNATTNIGGSGKNYQAYEILKDYPNIVLCPDRDIVGVKHMETIEGMLNHEPKWFYVPSRLWNSLPEKNGIDVTDFVIEKRTNEKLSDEKLGEVIMELIGAKKELTPQKKTEDKIVKFPVKPIDKDDIQSRLSELLGKGLKPSQETLGLVEIARDSGLLINEIKDIYRSLKDEVNKEDDKDFLQSEIKDIIKIQDADIDLRNYLPSLLANPISLYAENIGSNNMSMLTALLPMIASLVNPDTDLTLIDATKFTAKPIFFSAIVGESGSTKSPTIDLLFKGILSLQSKANKEYQRLKKEYEEYQGEEDIPEPLPIEYYLVDYTSEYVASLVDRQRHKGVLITQDELASLIKQSNAYRGGKGSDTEKILSARDGRGIKVNRKNGDRFDTEKSSISIVGGIQPEILRKQMGSCQDENGYWARFVYSYLPVKMAKFPDSTVKIDIEPLLTAIYQKIESLPKLNLRLDSTGRELYKRFFIEMEKLKVNEPNGAMRAVYSKYKRVAGEIALLLYIFDLAFKSVDVVDGVLTGCQQSDFLPSEFIKKGIDLAKIYIDQVKSIYLQNQNIVDGGISPI